MSNDGQGTCRSDENVNSRRGYSPAALHSSNNPTHRPHKAKMGQDGWLSPSSRLPRDHRSSHTRDTDGEASSACGTADTVLVWEPQPSSWRCANADAPWMFYVLERPR